MKLELQFTEDHITSKIGYYQCVYNHNIYQSVRRYYNNDEVKEFITENIKDFK